MGPLDDLLLRAVSQLPRIQQDDARAERTRARCHRKLQLRLQAARRRESTRRRLELVLIAGFSLVYLTALLENVLHWNGAL